MKNLFMAATILALFFTGCAQRSSVLNLQSYATNSQKTNYQKNIRINSVTDERSNKSIIATITDSDGNVDEYVTLQNDLAQWVSQSVEKELKQLGASLDGAEQDVAVDIKILELKANLTGYSGENLKGGVKMQIILTFGDQTVTKNVSQEQAKFAPIHTSGAFKSFFDELLQDIVKRAAIQILKS